MKKRSVNNHTILLMITVALFVILYIAGCLMYGDKGFTRLQNFLNILINNAALICVACGMTCVMLTGGIDISVGSLVAMDCMILAVGMEYLKRYVELRRVKAAGDKKRFEALRTEMLDFVKAEALRDPVAVFPAQLGAVNVPYIRTKMK